MHGILYYLFLFLAFLTIASALMVVLARSPISSVLWIIVTFISLTCHYFLLNAQFVGIVNLVVYAGAIMVLFLYVIFLLNLNKESEPHKPVLLKVAALVSGGLLLITLVAALRSSENMPMASGVDNNIGTIKNLGNVLFHDFLLPFEVSSILFLAAMVGAVMIGKGKPDEIQHNN
jgi:NADH-quinone oxidoreductase subunit J